MWSSLCLCLQLNCPLQNVGLITAICWEKALSDTTTVNGKFTLAFLFFFTSIFGRSIYCTWLCWQGWTCFFLETVVPSNWMPCKIKKRFKVLNQWQLWEFGRCYAEGQLLGLFPPLFITNLFTEYLSAQPNTTRVLRLLVRETAGFDSGMSRITNEEERRQTRHLTSAGTMKGFQSHQ